MTAVEAMACGTPGVITTEGGLWQMIAWGTEALYADPNDPAAFGHAIATVLRYPRIARQLARFGSHRARASFTWNGIAQQLLAVLSDVAERRRTTPWPEPSRVVDREPLEPEVEWIPVGSL